MRRTLRLVVICLLAFELVQMVPVMNSCAPFISCAVDSSATTPQPLPRYDPRPSSSLLGSTAPGNAEQQESIPKTVHPSQEEWKRTETADSCMDGAEAFWTNVLCTNTNHAFSSSNSSVMPVAWMNVTNPPSYHNAAITSDTTYLGPHVTFRANWSQLFIPDFPTIQIRKTRLELLTVVEQEHYGTILGPVVGGWHPDLNPREAYDYVFCEEGDEVYVEVEFGTWVNSSDPTKGFVYPHSSSDDLDIFVWPPGVEQTYANSIGWYAGWNPEVCGFRAPVTGNYTIGLDYYSGVVPMGWRCYVYTWHVDSVTMDGLACEMDTSCLGDNVRCDVRAVFLTGTSLDDGSIIDNFATVPRVTVTNFFPPTVKMIYPRGSERISVGPIVIRWNGSDVNVEETLHYAVDFSENEGATWQRIVNDTTGEEYTWDARACLSPGDFGPHFLVRVTATDGKFTANATSYPFTIEGPHTPPGIRWDLILTGVLVVTATILVSLTIGFVLLRRHRRRLSST